MKIGELGFSVNYTGFLCIELQLSESFISIKETEFSITIQYMSLGYWKN